MFDFGFYKNFGKTFENGLAKKADLSSDLLGSTMDAWVLAAQKGDLKAFGKIYDALVEKVYKYIFFKVDQETAFDLTETVFLKVWENLDKYSLKTGSSFTSWVFRIAHNLVIDHRRFDKETLPLDFDLADQKSENNPMHAAEQSLSKRTLKTALSHLKDTYQEVLTLSYLNGLGNEEVAQLMKKSEGGMRVLKFRALQELKKVLLSMGIKY